MEISKSNLLNALQHKMKSPKKLASDNESAIQDKVTIKGEKGVPEHKSIIGAFRARIGELGLNEANNVAGGLVTGSIIAGAVTGGALAGLPGAIIGTAVGSLMGAASNMAFWSLWEKAR